MWAPAELPFGITFLILLGMLIVLPFALSRFSKHPILITLGICALASIPTLLIVGEVVDSVRYGEFKYESAADISGDHFWIMPTGATDITMHKYASGHELKFQSGEQELLDWMSQMTKRRQEYSDATPFQIDSSADSTWFDNDFGERNWQCPADAVMYRGWRSARGSGSDIWYSKETGTVYISDAYW